MQENCSLLTLFTQMLFGAEVAGSEMYFVIGEVNSECNKSRDYIP
jgi:hypothetical protein